MKVLVMYEQYGAGVKFVMVARTEAVTMVSPIMTIRGNGSGNPYLVFGEACAKFTGHNWRDLTISCFKAASGGLEGWI